MFADALPAAFAGSPLNGLRALCAYNVVLDEVAYLKPATLATLLHNRPAPRDVPPEVRSIPEARAALRWCLERGQSLELLTKKRVLRRLRALLRPRPRLGGQGAIGATLFAAFGAELVVLHPDRLTPEFKPLLRDPRVLVPRRRRGRRAELVPAPRALRAGRCERHLILELPAGAPSSSDKRAPRATRLILAPHDPIIFSRAFEELLPTLRERLDLAVVAGFNHFGEDWRRKYAQASRHLRALREGSRRPLLHLECTAMTDPLKWQALAAEILPRVDSVGLNEPELVAFEAALRKRPAPPRVTEEMRVRALRRLRALGPSRVHLHTHGASYLLAEDPQDAGLHAVRFGATLGCGAAALGRLPRAADLRRPWSAFGVPVTPDWQIRRWGKEQEAAAVFRVETPLVAHPRLTVGLGDVISLGAVAAEARGRGER